MKNLLLALLLFVSAAAVGQDEITVSVNPREVALGTTNVTKVNLNPGHRKVMKIYFPSTNVGTVKVNTTSSTVTASPAYPAGTTDFLDVKDYFYIQLSNSADKFWISW